MTARLYHREHAFSGSRTMDASQIFDQYEQDLFTKVVAAAEKEGKPVSLLVVPATNVFDGIVATAQKLAASKIVCGLSNKLTADEQGKLTGDAWERLPEPRQAMNLVVVSPDGTEHEYQLGPHVPRLRNQDLVLLHDLWLELTTSPEFRKLHHYHVVSLALERLKRDMNANPDELIEAFRDELHRG
jgi:hypothetical protein